MLEVRDRVFKGLERLKKAQERVATLVKAESSDEAALREAGLAWEAERFSFENELIRPLPYRVRDDLIRGEDSIRRAWAIWFRPIDGDGLAELSDWTRKQVERAGGMCACFFWCDSAPSLQEMLSMQSWEPDWEGINVAIAHAKRVFDEYEEQKRLNLAPNLEEVKADIRVHVDEHQPPWWRDNKGKRLDQYRPDIEAGTLQIPTALQSAAVKTEIIRLYEPLDMANLVDKALEALRLDAELELFECQPAGEQAPKHYLLPAWKGTANGESPVIPRYDPESGDWVSSSEAAKTGRAKANTLRVARSKGEKFEDGAGIDEAGRIWRDISRPNERIARIVYLRSSLKNKPT